MDRTQGEILLVTVIMILLVLLFGSPIKQRVVTVGDNGQQGHGDGKSTHAPTETLKIVGREDIGA